ncbi:uncharacterized protein LOC108891481, partial [Lates japonicus]
EEAVSLLNQTEEKTRECFGEESEQRLIVTYGDLAWLKYHTGDYQQSQAYCQRVNDILVKYPVDSSTDLHPDVYGEKGWTFLKLSKSFYPRAIECFRKALELQPDNWEWNNGYAITLYRTELDSSELYPEKRVSETSEESPATKQLRRALELNPDDGVLMSMLALKLVIYKKHKEAGGLMERALEVAPDDPQVTRYVAKYLRKQDRLDDSIDLLKRVLRRSSQSAFIHHQLAMCYMRKKTNLFSINPRPERDVQYWRRLSIYHLEEALRLKSTLNCLKASLALQYAEDKDRRRAQEMFDDVLEKLEDEPASIRQSVYRYYAEFCHYHTIQKDLAVTYYTKGLEFSTKTSDGRFCMKKLKQMAERRLTNNPKDAKAHGILGAVAKAEGDWRKAVEYYEKALESDRNNDEYLSALCELCLEL